MSKLLPQAEIDRLDAIVMPFGKHQGKSMKNVPASYLDWLRDGNFNSKGRYPEVVEYLEKMGSYIDQELQK